VSDALHPCDGMAQAAMDKAYDRNAIRAKLAATGINPVLPMTHLREPTHNDLETSDP